MSDVPLSHQSIDFTDLLPLMKGLLFLGCVGKGDARALMREERGSFPYLVIMLWLLRFLL